MKAKNYKLPSGFPHIFRPRDLANVGIPRQHIRQLVKKGEAKPLGYGVYRVAGVPISEAETIAIVAKKIPESIVCLLTALRFHQIGTQSPRKIWIALHEKAWKPKLGGIPVQIVRFSKGMLTYGVVTVKIMKIPVRITSPARTVVDAFRYRRKIGIDIALEALRDSIVSRKTTLSDIMRTAKVCRISTIIRPYLEAIAS